MRHEAAASLLQLNQQQLQGTTTMSPPTSNNSTSGTNTSSISSASQTEHGPFITPEGQEFVRTATGSVIFINPANTQHFQEAQQQQLVNVSAGIGQIEDFDPDGDKEIYQELSEQYLEVNHVVSERRAAVLITVSGPRVYETLRDLCFRSTFR
ncbi:hypothetical protein QAD02_017266 [Eretmocerus hayati]|uniref:Uncharacterized protein n=1 Tax=Eretmocerus hayati TaxID=131215 RepID=A0ACC2PDU1_9HYME|nr:hypothetical protein QAD02_017266 [Eretmocerus hayati]